jgi:peptide subunit release factor 1 (eRF1)
MEKAKRIGIEAYKAELNEKIKLLRELLNVYDDGRRKGFYCLTVNLLELSDVKAVMDRLTDEIAPEAPLKEKATAAVRLFEAIATRKNISLKLRRVERFHRREP